jgi:putative endonuclease
MSSYYFGIFAEILTAAYYFLCGYKILHRRMRNYAGEIDLICKKGQNLIFIEVKARKFYNHDFNSWMISNKQKDRIIKAAEVFVGKDKKFSNHNMRFDIVIFSWNKWPTIIKNAWYIQS